MALSLDSEFYKNFSSFWPFLTAGANSSSVYEYIVHDVVDKVSSDYQKWVYSIIGCVLVGLSGIFPLLIFPNGIGSSKSFSYLELKSEGGADSRQLKRLLCFAVGSLLGDVFLHLLPEAWQSARASGESETDTLTCLGYWVLAGIVSFVICQMLVSQEFPDAGEDEEPSTLSDTSNNNMDKSKICKNSVTKQKEKELSQKQIAGYLNLVANGFDNFTHGLAVAGSFIISPKIGFLTTAAILMHEIPHEIGDFAILLRSGFNPWSAAKAQLTTATIGLAGAIFTLTVDCMQTMGDLTWWILPFTAGGFINIALTNLLPDLVHETDAKESFKQFASLLLGVGVMTLVTLLSEV